MKRPKQHPARRSLLICCACSHRSLLPRCRLTRGRGRGDELIEANAGGLCFTVTVFGVLPPCRPRMMSRRQLITVTDFHISVYSLLLNIASLMFRNERGGRDTVRAPRFGARSTRRLRPLIATTTMAGRGEVKGSKRARFSAAARVAVAKPRPPAE